jgi:hypothetical protein
MNIFVCFHHHLNLVRRSVLACGSSPLPIAVVGIEPDPPYQVITEPTKLESLNDNKLFRLKLITGIFLLILLKFFVPPKYRVRTYIYRPQCVTAFRSFLHVLPSTISAYPSQKGRKCELKNRNR